MKDEAKAIDGQAIQSRSHQIPVRANPFVIDTTQPKELIPQAYNYEIEKVGALTSFSVEKIMRTYVFIPQFDDF